MTTRVEDKKVKELMTHGVITMPGYSKVIDAISVLVEGHVHGVVITSKQNEMLGIVSEIDIVKAYGHDFEDADVRDIMSSPVRTVGMEDTINDASEIMKNEGIDRLLVVDERGRMRGILSLTDIINKIYSIYKGK